MSKLSVIIIARNEAPRIKTALESVAWADEIIVVDSESSDATVQIAKSFTDKVYSRKFDDFSSQKNFAISKCSNDWVFSLDCDEIVSLQLKDALINVVKASNACSAFRVKRINKIFGKVLAHAAGNDFPVRLFRKDKARFIQPIHEFLLIDGEVSLLDGDLFHNTTSSAQLELDKTEQYTDIESRFLLERNVRPSVFKIFFYPAAIFFNITLLKKGFLDGKAGLLYAWFSARYAFVKYCKARKVIKDAKYLEYLVAKRFDELSRQFPDSIDEGDSRLGELLDSFGKLEGKNILEVGCGKGRFTNAVSQRKAFCFGVDVSESLLKVARTKNNGTFLKASATNLPFEANTFDGVFAVEVVEHLPDLRAFLREAVRVLKQDGALVIIDRNILSLNNRRLLVPNLLIKHYHEMKNDWMYPRGFPYHEQWFLKNKIGGILKTYFSKVEAKYILSDSEKISPIKMIFKSIPLTRHFIIWKATGHKVL